MSEWSVSTPVSNELPVPVWVKVGGGALEADLGAPIWWRLTLLMCIGPCILLVAWSPMLIVALVPFILPLLFAICRPRILVEGDRLFVLYSLFRHDLWFRERALQDLKSAGPSVLYFGIADEISLVSSHHAVEVAAVCSLVEDLATALQDGREPAEYVRWGQPPSDARTHSTPHMLPAWGAGLHGGEFRFRHRNSRFQLGILSLIASSAMAILVGLGVFFGLGQELVGFAPVDLGLVLMTIALAAPLCIASIGSTLYSALSNDIIRFDPDHLDVETRLLGWLVRSERVAMTDVISIRSQGDRLVFYLGTRVVSVRVHHPDEELTAFATHFDRLVDGAELDVLPDPPAELLDLVNPNRKPQ